VTSLRARSIQISGSSAYRGKSASLLKQEIQPGTFALFDPSGFFDDSLCQGDNPPGYQYSDKCSANDPNDGSEQERNREPAGAVCLNHSVPWSGLASIARTRRTLLNHQQSMGISPEIFKSIEFPLLFSHQMDEYTRVIHDHPTAIWRPFSADRARAGMFAHILIDRIGRRSQLTDVIYRCNDEVICDRREVLNVEHQDVGGKLLRRSIRDSASKVCSVYLGLLCCGSRCSSSYVG
jgi:hypothetical protein